jgi:hypothetical protein
MVRCPAAVLVEQGRLSQEEAARQMGLSTRQVRRVLKRYRESGQRLESLAYQRRHPAWNALPGSTKEEIRRLHREYPKLAGTNRYLACSRNVEPDAYFELSASPFGHITCNCPGFTYRHVCKHAMALRLRLARERQKHPIPATPSHP